MNMKKTIIIAMIILAATLKMSGQEAAAPKIVFEETVFNFDTIMQNGNAEHVFCFANEGDAPLLITSAFSSCGCVVPEWPREPIAPKAKASIKVKRHGFVQNRAAHQWRCGGRKKTERKN